MSNSTQNDWADAFRTKFEGKNVPMNSVHPMMIDSQIIYIQKLLADARREVIRRIEAMPDKDVRPQITAWLESKEYCLGYNKALSNVLATLREEEGL